MRTRHPIHPENEPLQVAESNRGQECGGCRRDRREPYMVNHGNVGVQNNVMGNAHFGIPVERHLEEMAAQREGYQEQVRVLCEEKRWLAEQIQMQAEQIQMQAEQNQILLELLAAKAA